MSKRRTKRKQNKPRHPGQPKQWVPGRGKKARGQVLHWAKSHDTVKEVITPVQEFIRQKGRPVGFGASGEIMLSISIRLPDIAERWEEWAVDASKEVELFTDRPVPPDLLPASPADTIVVAGSEIWWQVVGEEGPGYPSLLAAVTALKLTSEVTKQDRSVRLQDVLDARDYMFANEVLASHYAIKPSEDES